MGISFFKIHWKTVEMMGLFVGIPLVLASNFYGWMKVLIVLTALGYVAGVMIKHKMIRTDDLYVLRRGKWAPIVARFIIMVILSVLLMYLFNKDDLFKVVLQKPWMWIVVTIFYSVFSVYPQEFIYRYFFFQRYAGLMKHDVFFLLVNATLFSFAHIAFKNGLVLVLTFLGGIIFAITYKRTQALLLTSVEHAMYGSWLFTLGMGEMLAFPV